MANIKVAVRVRPISPKEMSLTGSEVVVRTDLNEIFLTNLKVPFSKAGDSRERKRKYTFDYCFDSSNPEAEHFADQTRIYQTVGHTVLDAVFSGYNSCLVAYGQSASGKTYTMMGTKEEPGLTPRLCEGLFTRIEEERKHDKTYCVLVSYLEIYNERVRDLLKPSTNTGGLRVREHPRLGPYVQGLTHHKISTLASLMSYVEEGTKARKTASTQQNPSSSRSHALLTIAVAVESEGVAGGIPSSSSKKKITSRGESKLRLVDLAGSECAATCSGIYRLKESANINKSLVALGNVISALAERGSTRNGPGRRFIPYRDSSLTWLLKDALGGNATTIMLATISPACGSYNETAHTLRFAQRAQSVVNRPTINEDPVARVVRELRAEVTRLKALLLEKNVELDGKNMCICHKNLTQDSSDLNDGMKAEVHKLRNGEEFDEQRTTSRAEKRKELNSIIPLQRSNSTNNVIPLEIDRPMKKCNSFEVLVATDRFDGPYNCANVTEIKDEEQEVNEIHESVFVDIPTLVAVLIKPDDHLQQSTTQIEEICSDEVVETLIDVEDVEEYEDHEIPEIVESVDWQNGSNSVTSNHIPPGNEVEDFEKTQLFGENSTFNLKQRSKFRKQESVDSIATSVFSNLNTSRRFGSVETFQEKKDSVSPLSRSHTNLEKRSASVLESVNKLNDIREIDHHKDTNKHNWKVSKEQFQRKISIDSDRSLKETGAPSNTNIKDNTRKRSLDNFKRKDSKDSSSSSSKDEQILISNTTREKLLHRKDSIDQELASIRNHTPIQRAKRAEIVAAVTERLYSTRKQAEDALATRSPPENNEVKPAMKMKLQEISRRMLGKRRRVCVDTQTDCSRTVRMKDSASLTEMPQVICQDIGILTDHHVDCNYVVDNKAPVKRVKEISTLTEKPNTNIIRCKDATTLTNNHRGNDYDIDSSRNDSGVLSDDTQNHTESNSSSTIVSNLCQEANRKVACTDNSTNTRSFSSSRGFAVQTLQEEDGAQQILPNKVTIYAKQCYNGIEKSRDPMNKSESNVISICLPNTINITIENVNFPEPSVVIAYNESTTENDKFRCKDEEAQTDKRDDALMEIHGSKDRTRSMLNQTDGKVFRIENIFQDPNNVANSSKVDRVMGGMRIRNSITFRNSLGTSYMYQPKELKLNSAENVVHDEEFIRGLITEAFIHKKRNFNGRNSPSLVDYQNSWKDRFVQDSSKNINSVDHVSEKEVSLSPSQIKIDENNFSLRVNSTNDSILYDEPSCSSMSCNLDYDYGFSDDSLDYNENNQSKDAQETSEVKQLKDQSDNLCPPDVVAHIKGKCSQSPMESEKNEVTSDFDDSLSESATKSLTESVENTKQHDFESLIFDRVCQSYDEVTDDSDSSMSLLSYPEKKVSFSNIHISQEKYSAKQDTSTTLKSIIKNDKNKVVDDPWNVIHSLNGVGTDDSQQEKKSSTVFDNDWRGKIKSTSSEEVKVDKDSVEFKRNSNKNRKKVKFSVKESLQNTCSESDNYENMVDESKNENIFSSTGKNIFEEYLSEAVTFMRNFNLFNGNVSSRNTRERCRPFSCCGSQGYQATCRCSCVWNCNYLEYLGRKVNQKGDICNSVEDDDIVPSTASYERCLRGVQRLEECIQKIGRHNETLKEKYGFNCESASARLDLASSSTEHCASTTRDDSFKAFQEAHIPLERDYHRKEEKTKEDEDLEKTIFRQLMNAANNTIEHRRSNRLRDRLSKISDSTANNLSGSGKLQTEDNQQTKGSRCGDVTTSLSVERIPDGNCNESNFTMYEITGNVSIGKPRTPEDNHNDSHLKLDDCLLLSKGFDCFSNLDYTNRTVSKVSENRKVDDSDSLNYMYNTKVLCPVSRMSTDNIYEKFQEVDSYSRRGKDRIFSSGSSFSSCICSKHHLGIDKLKFSKSPRATLMELLHERRRIVECSRGTSLF